MAAQTTVNVAKSVVGIDSARWNDRRGRRGGTRLASLAFVVATLSSSAAWAVSAPENEDYFTGNFAAWNDAVNHDDESSGSLPIGFSFNYYGNSYTNFFASTNSLLCFGAGNGAYTNSAIPSSGVPNNCIYAFWDDLYIYGGKTPRQMVLYQTVGPVGSRKLIVQWTNMGFFSSTVPMGTFSIVLYEGSNDIQLQYRQLLTATADTNGRNSLGLSATIGIENSTGSAGIQYSNNTNSLTQWQAIRYSFCGNGCYNQNTDATYEPVLLGECASPPPDLAVLTSPDNGATVSRTPTFQWNEVSNADSYRVVISTSSTLNSPVVDQAGLTSPLYTVSSQLAASTTYYWAIVSQNSCGATWSAARSFITASGAPPVANAQSLSVGENGDLVITLTGSDAGGLPLTYRISSLPEHGGLYQYNGSGAGAAISSIGTIVTDSLGRVFYNSDGSGAGEGWGNFRFKVRNSLGVDSDEATIDIDVVLGNQAPSGISLSNASVAENTAAGASVGTLSATDPDAADSHTFTVVSVGSPFVIVGSQLYTDAVFDFEAQASYALTIRATDSEGLFVEQSLNVSISNANEAPTGIDLSSLDLDENLSINSLIGLLSTSDPDVGDSHDYEVIVGTTATISSGNELRSLLAYDFESAASHELRVRAVDAGGLAVEADFTITVNDRNDAPSSLSLSATGIDENSTLDAVIGTLSGVDVDAGDSLTFSLASAEGNFAVVGDELRVAAALDYEAAASHGITLRATDSAGATYDFEVSITVNDRNDAPTGFTSSATHVGENLAAGTVVGTLAPTDQDAADSHSFSILSSAAPFVIVGNELRTDASFDFESVASFEVTIEVRDAAGATFATTMNISIDDGNDAPSGFSLSETAIGEGAAIGEIVGSFTANDVDAADAHVYEILEPGVPFAIAGKHLQVADALNHEAAASATFTVRISDFAGAYVDQSVTVDITDENEAPTALTLSGVSIDENSAVGTVVATLSSSDVDAGDSATYEIIGAAGPFAVLGNNLEVAGSLDFEAQSSWDLELRVSDNGGLTFSRLVTLTLGDLNETPTSLALEGDNIEEDAELGTSIGVLAGIDPDAGEVLTYSLRSTDVPFAVNDAGDLSLTGDIDFEARTTYALDVRVSDAAGLFFDATVQVDIVNVNDVAPALEAASFSISEAAAGGSVVGTISGSDADGDSLGYTLVDSAGGRFMIDGTSGMLSLALATSLDRESAAQHIVSVEVSDGLFATTAAFTIQVLDENDNLPGLAAAVWQIGEDAAIGTLIGTLVAQDADASGITFSIAGGDDLEVFTVDPTDGALSVASALDFETRRRHVLDIAVSDGSNIVHSSATILILDVNDNTPSAAPQTFMIDDSDADGAILGHIRAEDRDAGVLTYSITGGDGTNLFAVSPADGTLILRSRAALDSQAAASFSLEVTISDGVHSTVVTLTLNRRAANNAAPTFAAQSFEVTLPATAALPLGQVLAADPETQPLTFTLLGGNENGRFSLETTGALSVGASSLTLADGGETNLLVQVSDGWNSAQANVRVTLNAGNTHAPVMARRIVSVQGQLDMGSVITSLEATDADGGAPSFTLSGGNTDGLFALDSDGRLGAAIDIDFDGLGQAAYVLDVEISDGELTSHAEVELRVVPAGSHAPEIDAATLVVLENSPLGTELGSIVAADADGDALTYGIVGGSAANLVVIDAATGALCVIDPLGLDHEGAPAMTLIVSASDGWNISRAAIVLEVDDVNDEAPVMPAQIFSISETAPEGTVVGAIAATDADGPSLTFRVVDAAASFVVRADSNILEVAAGAVLDFEATVSHLMFIEVDDGVHRRLAPITVRLGAENDNAPVASGFSTTVNEGLLEGGNLGTVTGTDADGDTLSFTFGAGNEAGVFAIDSDKGTVSLAISKNLDFETGALHALTVLVSDGWNMTPVQVEITVTNDNDIAPSLVDQILRVKGDLADGLVLGTLDASDADGDTLTFALRGRACADCLSIDATTGEITVQNAMALGEWRGSALARTVTVSDGQHEVRATLHIEIRDSAKRFEGTTPTSASAGGAIILGEGCGCNSSQPSESFVWLLVAAVTLIVRWRRNQRSVSDAVRTAGSSAGDAPSMKMPR